MASDNESSGTKTGNWADRFKNNFVVTLLSMLVIGFSSGIGAARFFVEWTNQVLITQNRLTELEKIEKDHQNLVKEHQKLIEQCNNLNVSITVPRHQESVDKETIFKGTASRKLKPNEHLWLVVNPFDSRGWYPQNTEIALNHDNSWEHKALIGQGQEDSRRNFNVVVVLANESANTQFNEYLENGRKNKDYPEQPLPNGTIQLDKITVTRK